MDEKKGVVVLKGTLFCTGNQDFATMRTSMPSWLGKMTKQHSYTF